jgi:hypothetical protein
VYGSGHCRLPSQHHHTATLTAVELPALRCPPSTTATTRRCASAPPAQHLAALTAALHTGLRELAAVTFGWLDTLPITPGPPLTKGPIVMTGPGLPDTIVVDLGVDKVSVLLSRIRAAAGGRAGRLTQRRQSLARRNVSAVLS